MISFYFRLKRVFFTLFVNFFVINSLFASVSGFIYDGDEGVIINKTINKMREMGEELYRKTGVTTIIVTRKHLDKQKFLSLKKKYILEAKKPYVLWIFSKTYEDRKDIGLNQMFNSRDLNDKFDKDSLFSPFSGSFTKLLTIHQSKLHPKFDVISPAFLNGYADLVDMLADSYNIKLKSSIGSESQHSIDVIRVIFYSLILLAIIRFLYLKIKK